MSQHTVLLVEDNVDSRMIYGAFLARRPKGDDAALLVGPADEVSSPS